jgi:hypothetical protein
MGLASMLWDLHRYYMIYTSAMGITSFSWEFDRAEGNDEGQKG